MAVREDYVPPLEDISRTVIARDCHESPTTGAGEGWREKRGHHALKRETNSLASACHAPMHGRRGSAASVGGSERCRQTYWRGACHAKVDGGA
jgi:hypothetical protein